MNAITSENPLVVGFNIPAEVGMDECDVQTPCLILDLDALERNIQKMGQFAKQMGVRHRIHGKMHKSVDVALLQEKLGGSCGVCCQKVSEAEAFVRGGIRDVLVSNQVRDPAKIDRLARLPLLGARTICCVDDIDNVPDLSSAAQRHGSTIECLVEIDCGAGRCGVTDSRAVVEIAEAISAAEGLQFAGIQAYPQPAIQNQVQIFVFRVWWDDVRPFLNLPDFQGVEQCIQITITDGRKCRKSLSEFVGGHTLKANKFKGIVSSTAPAVT